MICHVLDVIILWVEYINKFCCPCQKKVAIRPRSLFRVLLLMKKAVKYKQLIMKSYNCELSKKKSYNYEFELQVYKINFFMNLISKF